MSGETEGDVSGWTVDTVAYFFQRQLDDMRTHLDERYVTQTKATDKAFEAQQTAMQTAFIAAEKAVDIRQANSEREFHEHLAQNRHETDLAFLASDKAISKAEDATEKRFNSVNEFRAQLADQATRFVGKDEYSATQQRLDEKVSDLQRRLDKNEGRGAGYAALYGWAVAGISLIIAVIIFANSLTGKT